MKTFLVPLQGQLDRMALNTTARNSPLLDGIRSATEQLKPYWAGASARRIIMFSDLMENVSGKFSQYDRYWASQSYDEAKRKVGYLADVMDLRGVVITVYYMTGLPDAKPFQGSAHQQFWRNLFAAHGATVEFIELPRQGVASSKGG